MTIKPQYTKYKKRVGKGLLRIIILTIIWTILVLKNDFEGSRAIMIISISASITILLAISIITKNKNYLKAIRIENDYCEFETNVFDKQKKVIITRTSETRIIIWEIVFSLGTFGRNFKLVVETKQGLTYKRILQQYEIGDWDLEKFKEVVKLYGEKKGVPAPTTSFTRGNFPTSDN
jgi:hypothetical protein